MPADRIAAEHRGAEEVVLDTLQREQLE